jgi:hypothetical protein
MREQDGARCFICDREPAQRFAIDHNYDTKDVRGLPCKQCNYAMGQFGNDPGRLRRAAEFLELRDESKRSLEADIMDAIRELALCSALEVRSVGTLGAQGRKTAPAGLRRKAFCAPMLAHCCGLNHARRTRGAWRQDNRDLRVKITEAGRRALQ